MFNGRIIRKLRNAKHMSQKELAEKLSVPSSNIHRLETSTDKNITINTLIGLARALDTTPDYLLQFSDINESEFYNVVSHGTGFIKTPIYGTVPAGRPIEALEVDEGYIDIPSYMFDGGKKLIGLKVKGDSMFPYYLEGDVIVIEITPDFNNGDDVVVFVGFDNEATLKRIYKKGDTIELQPLNPLYPKMKYTARDEPVRVLGVVKQLIRNVQ